MRKFEHLNRCQKNLNLFKKGLQEQEKDYMEEMGNKDGVSFSCTSFSD